VTGEKDYSKLDFIVYKLKEGFQKKTLIFCDSLLEVDAIFFNYFWAQLDESERVSLAKRLVHYNLMTHTASTDAQTKAVVATGFGTGGNCKILISTISFVMGVDVADIRRVIIWGMPGDALTLWQVI